MLSHFATNFGGSIRRETRNGREYLIAPMTLIVPGVLQGSQGPLYYPPEEVRRNPAAWNGTPITVGHPQRRGKLISGRSAGVPTIGTVRSAKANGKLTAEGVFDIAVLRRVDDRLLEALKNGERLELSTGVFIDNLELAPQGASYRGRPYTHVARDLKPDHLAILPDQIGACSVQDGCGVNNEDCRCFKCMTQGFATLAAHLNPEMEEIAMSEFDDDLPLPVPTFNVKPPLDPYGGQDYDGEILPLPTLNYAELSPLGKRRQQAKQEHETEPPAREDADEDILELPTLNYEELSWKGQRR